MTGKELDYNKHVHLEFGEYVQTHKKHDNTMAQRTLGAVCLGPTGNKHGTHWFMNLITGERITRTFWTEMPMPELAQWWVSEIGRQQRMPKILMFGNHFAEEIKDTLNSVDDDNESYVPDEEEGDDESLEIDDGNDDSDNDDHGLDLDPDVNDDASHDNVQPHGVSDEGEPNDVNDEDLAPDDGNFPSDEGNYNLGEDDDDDADDPPLMETIDEEDEDTDKSDGNEGVNDIPECQGANDNKSEDEGVEGATSGKQGASDDDSNDEGLMESEAFERAASHGATAADSSATGRPKCMVWSKMMDDNIYEYVNTNVHAIFEDMDTELMFTLLSGDDEGDMLSFIMAQMSAKGSIKQFGKKGKEAIMLELEQLLYHKVMQGHDAKTLTKQQKQAALKYLMFLKEKHCGKIKGCGCADGWKQRLYKTKDEMSLPMISIESLFLTCLIDAMEERCVITCDIPGAFMQTDINELIHIKLEGELAELLVCLDPTYQKFITYKNKKLVIYTELSKALYGTLQAALLFWKDLTKFLKGQGFESNPYDWCIMNKNIDSQQCMVRWHVDDLKILHVDDPVVEGLVSALNDKYGKEAPLSVTHGKVHDYLGMTIDYSMPRKVTFSMPDYVEGLIHEMPDELLSGQANTLAANHLFNINDNATKLDEEQVDIYHHLMVKLLYLCKQVCPDTQLAVVFLTMWVQSPDLDDWKKLGQCLTYIRNTKELDLMLKSDMMSVVHWWCWE